MKENELKYYEKIGNWDFSKIKCKTEELTNWDFYERIKENTNEKSLCLDLGTGGGEKSIRKISKCRNDNCYRFFKRDDKNCKRKC